MKNVAFRVFKIAIVLIVVAIAFLYLMRSKPVFLSIPPDDTIRPRNFCIMNPFRETSSETVAETYLQKMRDGDIDSISQLFGNDEARRNSILEVEKKYPVRSWRIGDRKDSKDKVLIMYWVTRGGEYGTGIEEEVHLWLVRTEHEWAVQTYSAIY